MSADDQGKQHDPRDPAWRSYKLESLREHFVLALVMIVAGFFLFLLVQSFEDTDGPVAAPWPVVLLYAIGGKWLVGGICWALGGLAALYGLYQYLFTDTV